MRRLLLGTTLLLVAAMVASLGVQRVFHLGLTTVLWPVEPDRHERALISAAGSGDVTTVRSLLAQGVRAEPETLIAAATGAFEPFFGGSGCARHAEIARLLLDANPRLKPGHNPRAYVLLRASRIRRCDVVNRLIE